MSILNKISSPKDIKNLSIENLNLLSGEIRNRIINVLSKNGGHLASNLGVVELSIAMHYVFNSPTDKFLFDVSHQTYTHKLLTNRNKNFDSIRQFQGLCGFSNPEESIHDHFYQGHAGTSVSLSLGLAKKRDLINQDEHILSLIGDATLTCGLTLEALNNIDKNLKNFIIILNDNDMSISKNVGNIKNILRKILSNPKANKFYLDIQNLISKIPTLGKKIVKQNENILDSLKKFVTPAAFFDHFNLSYTGPIDGHDIKMLIDTFNNIKNSDRPIVMHVVTTKGKGMEKAILNPISYHGAKPFNIETGDFLCTSKTTTFPKIFGKAILNLAKKDPKIVVISPAMLKGSSLDEFKKEYPNRCFDVGIAEGHALTFAGGLAHDKKLKVVVSIYSTFLQRAFDNLYHDICLQKLPIIFAIDRAGLSGPDGSTHHGIYDISFLNAMPNMIIAQPRDGNLLKDLLFSSFDFNKPMAIRYPNSETIDTLDAKKITLDSYDILSKGEDLLIVSIGHMCNEALKVKEILNIKNINPTIVDPIFIKPLNKDLFIELFKSHKKIITIEENSIKSSFASILNNFIIENNLSDLKVLNFALPDNFIPHGKNQDLLNDLNLNPKKISNKILDTFYIDTLKKEEKHDYSSISE
jgi:1-deoxy-D-xylulose-5-phosphate synthase